MSLGPIGGFRSGAEFRAFHDWIMSRVADGAAEQVDVKAPYSGSLMFRQAWLLPRESRTVWRLVWPDGPFRGVFEKIPEV